MTLRRASDLNPLLKFCRFVRNAALGGNGVNTSVWLCYPRANSLKCSGTAQGVGPASLVACSKSLVSVDLRYPKTIGRQYLRVLRPEAISPTHLHRGTTLKNLPES